MVVVVFRLDVGVEGAAGALGSVAGFGARLGAGARRLGAVGDGRAQLPSRRPHRRVRFTRRFVDGGPRTQQTAHSAGVRRRGAACKYTSYSYQIVVTNLSIPRWA
jgi:hypothetical protein